MAAALALAGAVAVLVAVVPGGAAPHTLSAVGVPGERVGVDDFRFASFDAHYELGRDAEGRSTLRTREHLVAVFPDIEQNRGIRRAIPAVYDGHETHPQIVAVTDADGTPRLYASERDGDFLVLTIAVPVGQFVHGEQHYLIEYTERDVTRHFADTGVDEFYRDVNGTGWAQPFDEVAARVELEPELAAAATGAGACYRGVEGSDLECPITRDGDAFVAAAGGLFPRESMSIAIAFAPGTFTPAPFDLFAIVPPLVLAGGVLIGGTIIGAILYRVLALRAPRERGTIVAWYEPPGGITVPIAANLLRVPQRAFTATVLDLAVRGHVRILTQESGDYGVRLIDRTGLRYEEEHLLSRLFWSGSGAYEMSEPLVTPDLDTRWFDRKDATVGFIAASVRKNADRLVLERGLRRKPPYWPAGLAVLGLALGLILFNVHAAASGSEEALTVTIAVGINILIWVALGCVTLMTGARPLTPEGALAVEHLQGLREYIRLAEADRLQMLQSASGAERVATSDDDIDVVKVYERLLPYAVLFGLEKEWQAELERHLGDTSPTWTDSGVANVAAFSVASFSSGLAAVPGVSSGSSSWGSSSGSSSSGGSSGGGSSGGGGGGGGGGGV